MKPTILSVILFLFLFNAFGQNGSKIYIIRQFNPSQLFKFPGQYQKEIKLKAVGAIVYYSTKDYKIDSLYTTTNNVLIHNDTIAFTLTLPQKCPIEKVLQIKPIYYPESDNNKGSLPKYILGNEQQVNRIKLKIKSNPSGATVYLIPKIYWDQQKRLSLFDPESLSPYIVSRGTTTVTTDVQEYVYIAVFENKRKYFTLQFAPSHFNPVDSIYKSLK